VHPAGEQCAILSKVAEISPAMTARVQQMATRLLPTSLVGSYPQPDWLIDRAKLASRFPPRVRARELWGVAPDYLKQAQDDATLLAIRDQERAGLDIITDGECAAKAIPIASLRRLKASTSKIRALHSTAQAIPIQCRASLVRCAVGIPSRWKT
jgi:hypothetical protein